MFDARAGLRNNITPPPAATNIFLSTSGLLTVYCDQGGSPGTGDFFGEPCH